MPDKSSISDLKEQIISNQKTIDDLNSDLARKTREVRIIQEVLSEINMLDLDNILKNILYSLDKIFDFKHSMILLVEKDGQSMTVAASQNYKEAGIGAKVPFGRGIIGVVAKQKKIMRMGNIGAQMTYFRAVKEQMLNNAKNEAAGKEIKLPGLPDVESQVAIPLLMKDKLIGVLSVESNQADFFDERDEFIIKLLAEQAGSAIEKARLYKSEQQKLADLNEAHEELKQLNDSLEQKVEDRTKELAEKSERLEQVNEVIGQKNQEITDSIKYAERIQKAILPVKNDLNKLLPDAFIYYQPKDIISGDFYWFTKKDGKVIIAVVDCTGHGVPGALMTTIDSKSMSEIIIKRGITCPKTVLEELNITIVNTLKQSASEESTKDGMDIAICSIDLDCYKLNFAGAYRPLYLIRNNELQIIKGDRLAIGGYSDDTKIFTNHEIDYQSGDTVYLFSDGYADQFGGPDNQKFMTKRFKQQLLDIQHENMQKQAIILEETFEKWKQDEEQTDDVLVIGIRF